MVHHAVTKIGGKDFARFWPRSDKADRSAWPVSMAAEFLLQPKEISLSIHFKRQGIYRIALVPAALPIVPPQGAEGIDVRADHRQPRTARTCLSLSLLSLFTLPLLKLTFHALSGLVALEVDDQ